MTRLTAGRRAGAVLCALLACAALPAAADVYRWVDADGKVHFADKPPPAVDAERLPIQTSPTDLEATLRALAEREREFELRQQLEADAAEDAAAAAEYAAKLARSCAQARERVAAIESARRLSRVAEDGSRHTYDEDERAAALSEARGQVEDWCR